MQHIQYPAIFVGFFYMLALLSACGGGTGDNTNSTSSRSADGSSSSAAPQLQDFSLQWTPPNARENGDYLELHELGGYELRYNANGKDTTLTFDNRATTITLTQLPNNTRFEIAAFDTNGLYSRFVVVAPK